MIRIQNRSAHTGACVSLVLAATVLGAATLEASTLNSTLVFSDTSQDMFGLGANVDFTNRGSFGIANTASVGYGMTVSSGLASAQINAQLSTDIARHVTLNEAGATSIRIDGGDVQTAFDGRIGADLFVDINMDRFSVDLGFTEVSADPPNLRNVVDKDFNLDVSGSRTGFGAATDTARISEAGIKTPSGLGAISQYVPIDVDLSATLDVVQTSRFSVSDITGIFEATNGAISHRIPFSMKDGLMADLDLSAEGTWQLSLNDLVPIYEYTSVFSLDPTARAQLDVFGWSYDRRASARLVSTDYTASLDFGMQSLDLGQVRVTASVPLPGGLPLMAAALLGLAGMRRRA